MTNSNVVSCSIGKSPGLAPRIRLNLSSVMLLVGVTALGAGCTLTPADREAAVRAWAERDLVHAAECARRGGRYFDSTCLQAGGP